MTLEKLTLSELLTLKECLNALNLKYQNKTILEGKANNEKCMMILKKLEDVMNEIEKKVFEYD